MKKRFLAALLVLCLVLALLPVNALAAENATSGTCGSNAYWSFDASTGTLTISGSGAMDDYAHDAISGDFDPHPWIAYQDDICSVVVEQGITRIGDDAFGSDISGGQLSNLTTVSLPSTLKEIGVTAFGGSPITSVTLPDGLTTIEGGAFWGTRLTSVYIPASVESIGRDSRYGGTWDAFYSSTLSQITVAPGNRYFTVENNVLYDKGKTKIVCYPRSNPLSDYVIPSTITQTLYISNFSGIDALQSITIPDGVTLTAHEGFNPPDGSYYDNSQSIILYFQGDVPEITSDWCFSRNGALINIDARKAETGGNATIIGFSPANGTIDVGYAGNSPSHYQITFDREIVNDGATAQIDLSNPGAFSIYRASDDTPVFQSNQYMTYSFHIVYQKENILSVTATSLEPGTEYYVTMDAGIVTFKDGTTNPAIEKGDWGFTTKGQAVTPPLKTNGYFQYASSFSDKNGTYPYSYDEEWFLEDSSEYNHDLAKMSLAMAMSAFDIGGNTYKARAANIIDLFEQLGFSYTANSICYDAPTTDSIGYAIGSKTVLTGTDPFTLVVVAIRGSGYGQEWASNFSIGTASEHAGFASAANTVSNAVETYIKSLGVSTNIKIWLTGYSRAAATANIAAQRLTGTANSKLIKGLSAENIYAYCFACPRTVRTDDLSYATSTYKNIHNIVNYIDLVPKVAPEAWDFDRYGITYYLPSAEQTSHFSSAYNQMVNTYVGILSQFAFLDVGATAITATAYSKGQGSTFDDIVDAFASHFYSQSVYTAAYQDQIRSLWAGFDNTEDAATLITDMLLIILPSFKVLHPIITDKLIANVFNIVHAHYPEQYLAWMNTIDGESGFVSSRVRQLKINCPVNIAVYDSNNTLVAQIINDTVIDIEDSTIAAYWDEYEQKVIILPVDEEYTVEISATDSGTVTYTVTEYNIDAGSHEKVVSYYQINVIAGDELTGIVENLDEVDSAVYPLYLNNDTESLTPSVVQSGDAVEKYAVSVSSSGNGSAYGSGSYVSGEYSKVVATPDSGETFLGWYVNGVLVSSDTEYRFLVDQSIEITAKFTANTGSAGTGTSDRVPSYTVNVSQTSNGSVTVSSKSASQGDLVTVTVTPDEGYEIEDVTVTDRRGHELRLRDKGDGKYTFTMPASRVTVSVSFAEIEPEITVPAGVYIPVSVANLPFTDVPEYTWYSNAVLYVCRNGLMNGVSTYRFAPEATTSRAMIVTILYRLEGEPAVGTSAFTDVAPGAWYAKAVSWAAANGIVNGYGDGTFAPDKSITREEMAAILYRYAAARSYDVSARTGLYGYADAAQVSGYAVDAMQWVNAEGLITGVTTDTLVPQGSATRAEVATILMRFCENIAK